MRSNSPRSTSRKAMIAGLGFRSTLSSAPRPGQGGKLICALGCPPARAPAPVDAWVAFTPPDLVRAWRVERRAISTSGVQRSF